MDREQLGGTKREQLGGTKHRPSTDQALKMLFAQALKMLSAQDALVPGPKKRCGRTRFSARRSVALAKEALLAQVSPAARRRRSH